MVYRNYEAVISYVTVRSLGINTLRRVIFVVGGIYVLP